MAKIRWSPKAGDEFEEICEYLEKSSPFYSQMFARKGVESIDQLKKSPNLGRMVPEFENPNIRELIYKSYRIIYRILDDIIEIITIFHGSRNFTKS